MNMLKTFLLVSLCLLAMASPSQAQFYDNPYLHLMGEDDEAADGDLYAVTLIEDNVHRYPHHLRSQRTTYTADSLYAFKSVDDPVFSRAYRLLANTELFRVVSYEGKQYLVNVNRNLFVGSIHKNEMLFTPVKLVKLNDHVSTDHQLSLIYYGGAKRIRLGTKYLGWDDTKETVTGSDGGTGTNKYNYGMYEDISTARQVQTYRVSDYGALVGAGGDDAMTLASIMAAPHNNSTRGDTLVLLDRQFDTAYYNTLMLPFDVEHYKVCFGLGVTAYVLRSATDSTVTFVELDGDSTLHANTPYLLRGNEFFAPPYPFPVWWTTFTAQTPRRIRQTVSPRPAAQLQYQGADVQPYRFGSLTFNGVYHSRAVGATDSYILWRDQFVSCANVPSLNVEPFRWYITAEGGRARLKSIEIVGSSTGITSLREGNGGKGPHGPQDGPAYNVAGQQVSPAALSSRGLPTIVITRGHKQVVR